MLASTFAAIKGCKDGVINVCPLPGSNADSNSLNTILNVVFTFAGSIALLMIVIGGFRYVISRGDPNAMAQAKNTILYAIVGLIIVLAAYSIVIFAVKGIS